MIDEEEVMDLRSSLDSYRTMLHELDADLLAANDEIARLRDGVREALKRVLVLGDTGTASMLRELLPSKTREEDRPFPDRSGERPYWFPDLAVISSDGVVR